MASLVERLREAASREGKPSGRHMVDGQRLVAKTFRRSNVDEAHDIADVAETMAACIENEATLFDALAPAALEAAAELERQADRIEALEKALGDAKAAMSNMAATAFFIGLEGSKEWDEIAGSVNLHGEIARIETLLALSDRREERGE